MDRPESFELSKLEIQGLTGWPDTLVEDYRQIGEAINQLFDYIQAIADNPAPATSTSAGVKGQIAIDNDFLYICIDDDLWKRVAVSAW